MTNNEPNTAEHILREKLWNNKFIQLGKKLLLNQDGPNMVLNCADDIINDQGNFKSKAELKTDFDINVKVPIHMAENVLNCTFC